MPRDHENSELLSEHSEGFSTQVISAESAAPALHLASPALGDTGLAVAVTTRRGTWIQLVGSQASPWGLAVHLWRVVCPVQGALHSLLFHDPPAET